jgi:hypothetical protein
MTRGEAQKREKKEGTKAETKWHFSKSDPYNS